jgi:N-acetylmuramoyl-L-alanine amidase
MKKIRIILAMLFAFMITLAPSVYADASIEHVSAYLMNDGTRVIINLNQKVTYQTFSLENPNRVVVDISGMSKTPTLVLPAFKHVDWISKMRIAANSATKQRIVFDLTQAVDVKVSLEPPVDKKPWRLVIDLTPQFIIPAQSIPSKPVLNKAVADHDDNRCVHVVIDPGHGGGDPGAVGLNGTKEKDVVLAVGKDLYKLINDTPGMCAHLTRDKDVFVTLRGRLDIARKDRADLFVAIHADIFNDPGARGASVFALSPRGATSEAARWLAQSENSSESLGGADFSDQDKSVQSILLDLSQTQTVDRSLQLGDDVLRDLDHVSKLHHSDVEQAGFLVLKSPDIPSILVETGFLSNRYEEEHLRLASYQTKIAQAIYKGIVDYVYTYPPADTQILTWQREKTHSYVVVRGDSLSAIALRYDMTIDELKEKNRLAGNTIHQGQTLVV